MQVAARFLGRSPLLRHAFLLPGLVDDLGDRRGVGRAGDVPPRGAGGDHPPRVPVPHRREARHVRPGHKHARQAQKNPKYDYIWSRQPYLDHHRTGRPGVDNGRGSLRAASDFHRRHGLQYDIRYFFVDNAVNMQSTGYGCSGKLLPRPRGLGFVHLAPANYRIPLSKDGRPGSTLTPLITPICLGRAFGPGAHDRTFNLNANIATAKPCQAGRLRTLAFE